MRHPEIHGKTMEMTYTMIMEKWVLENGALTLIYISKSNDGNLVEVPDDNGTTDMYLDTIVGLQSNSNYTILGIKSDPSGRSGVTQEGGGAFITQFKGKTTGMFASSFEEVSRGSTNYKDTTTSIQVGDPMANGNDNPSMHLGISENMDNNQLHNYAELSAYSNNSSNIYNGINMEHYFVGVNNSYGVTRMNTDTLEIHPTNYSQNSNDDTYLRVFGKIDVNSSYVLPSSSGQPGEVLKVPAWK